MKKRAFYITVCYLLLVLLSSCDYSIVIVQYDFGQHPRLIYIANVDTELDFSDATLFTTSRDGFQSDEYPMVLGDWITIEHSIDFTTPGKYEVKMIVHHTNRQFPITFYVQVVDE